MPLKTDKSEKTITFPLSPTDFKELMKEVIQRPAPKTPWIRVKGQFKDPYWVAPQTAPWKYLEYEHAATQGQK